MSSADAWATPLGEVPLDPTTAAELEAFPFVDVDDTAHADEHSLEVQLPFLQTILADWTLVPLVVGSARVDDVAAVIDVLWSGPETLVVVSSDLSHYHHYDEATERDARTASAITSLRSNGIDGFDACGAGPLRGLLRTLEQRRLSIEALDLRNSGDTSGDRDRVVGYGAFAVA